MSLKNGIYTIRAEDKLEGHHKIDDIRDRLELSPSEVIKG